jgi:hypothetical protein
VLTNQPDWRCLLTNRPIVCAESAPGNVGKESAKLNGHDPWVYLKDVLERLHTRLESGVRSCRCHQVFAVSTAAASAVGILAPCAKCAVAWRRYFSAHVLATHAWSAASSADVGVSRAFQARCKSDLTVS